MRLIIPADPQANEAIGTWCATKLGTAVYPPYFAVGVAHSENEPLKGALVFNQFNGHQIEMTGYGPGAFTASVIRSAAHYVFKQLGCSRLSATTRRGNVKARRLLGKHFKFEGCSPRYFGNEDALRFYMLAEDCPWLEKKINGIDTQAA